MKILRLHIENFGKLKDFDAEFESGLNQILQDNGWGKSTLSTFIKSMFFGLEAKGRKKDFQSERGKFAPWQGGVFGGNLTFSIKDNIYTIYRTFGKTPEQDFFQLYNEKTKQISNDFSQFIGEEIFGVGEQTFNISSYFGQASLTFDLNDETISNLAGLEKFKNDAENVDSAINLLEKKRKELVSLTPKQIELNQIEKSINQLEKQIDEKEYKAKKLKENLEDLKIEKDKVLEKKKILANEKKELFKSYKEKSVLQEQLNEKNAKLNEYLSSKDKVQNLEKSSFSLKLIYSIIFFGGALIFLVLAIANLLNSILAFSLSAILFILSIIFFILNKTNKNKRDNKKIKEDIQIEEKLKYEIEILSKAIMAFPNFDFNKYDQMEEVSSQVEEEYTVVLTNYKEYLSEIDSLKEELSMLIENYQDLQNLINTNLRKIELLKMTMNYFVKARDIVSQRFVQPLNDKFKSIFDKFKINENIDIDSKLNASIVTSAGIKNVEFLSKGLQDLVSICQRFTLLDKIYKKEKPFIILDDSFVNIDDKKIKIVKEILEILSNDYQIIYFACSQSRIV